MCHHTFYGGVVTSRTSILRGDGRLHNLGEERATSGKIPERETTKVLSYVIDRSSPDTAIQPIFCRREDMYSS